MAPFFAEMVLNLFVIQVVTEESKEPVTLSKSVYLPRVPTEEEMKKWREEMEKMGYKGVPPDSEGPMPPSAPTTGKPEGAPPKSASPQGSRPPSKAAPQTPAARKAAPKASASPRSKEKPQPKSQPRKKAAPAGKR